MAKGLFFPKRITGKERLFEKDISYGTYDQNKDIKENSKIGFMAVRFCAVVGDGGGAGACT